MIQDGFGAQSLVLMRALALDDTPELVLRWDDGAECESIVHCNGDGSEGKGEGNAKDDREGNSKG